MFDGEAPGAVTLADLRARGAATGEAVVAERLARVGPRDVATIVYTSGTTGPPKGCVVTHASLLATVAMYVRRARAARPPDGDLPVPAARALARARRAVRDARGRRHARLLGRRPEADRRRAGGGPPDALPVGAADLREGPRGRAQRRRRAGPRQAARSSTGRSARAAGRARPPARARRSAAWRPRATGSPTGSCSPRCAAVFGDRLAMALCGAAPIGREVLEFFDACGVLVLEGYGMTETCAAATLNTPRAVRFGSVGRPLAGHRGGDRRGRRDPDGRPARVRRATTATPTRRARS